MTEDRRNAEAPPERPTRAEAEAAGAAQPAGEIPVEEAPRRRRPARLLLGAAALAALALGALWLSRPAVEEEAPPLAPAEPAPPGFLDGGAGFAVQVGSLAVPYRVFAVTALPGDTLEVEALFVAGDAEAEADGGALARTGPREWAWTAPAEPGLSRILVTAASGETITLHVFTLVPFDHSTDAIGGYAIGDYQDTPMGGNPAYDEPPGFVRVTPENRDTPVSPHFTLGQFLAKQESGWPKYLALSGPLLLKLERVLYAVNAAGVPARGAHRHVRVPDAGLQRVDREHDGLQPPPLRRRRRRLRRRGRRRRDGPTSTATATSPSPTPSGSRPSWRGWPTGRGTPPLVGGLGVYSPAPHRGPFVHVDTRGEPVRW